MIIQSTTLDTMDKVIEIYGGTTWIKIEGRMLMGQSDSYSINSTGGFASQSYTPKGNTNGGAVLGHQLTQGELPTHNHSGSKSVLVDIGSTAAINMGVQMCSQPAGNYKASATSSINVGGGQYHTHPFTNPSFTGVTESINTLPPYKSVYIWERTA